MVDGDASATAAPAAQGASDTEGAAQGATRRAHQAQKETVQDELASETRRHTLLDAVEHQLKAVPTRARLLLACNIPDDKKAVAQIETEFGAWAKKLAPAVDDAEEEEGAAKPTAFGGLFVIQPGQALHFMEGTAEQLFAGLKAFQGLSDISATGGDKNETPRGALVNNLRIIYFTEVHGVQTMNGWHSFHHLGAKSMGGPVLFQDDEQCFQAVFMAYRKLLVTNCKVMEALPSDADDQAYKTQLKSIQDGLPTLDELTSLLHKTAADYFFNYAEFEKAFCAPFHLVLQSELLWPMPPPLSY
jgi:hypothetical protein